VPDRPASTTVACAELAAHSGENRDRPDDVQLPEQLQVRPSPDIAPTAQRLESPPLEAPIDDSLSGSRRKSGVWPTPLRSVRLTAESEK